MRILPISDKQLAYAEGMEKRLREAGFRTGVDKSSEKLGAKIRAAQLMKTPYMLVVGGRDEQNGTVSVRARGQGDLGAAKLEDFIARLEGELDG